MNTVPGPLVLEVTVVGEPFDVQSGVSVDVDGAVDAVVFRLEVSDFQLCAVDDEDETNSADCGEQATHVGGVDDGRTEIKTSRKKI